MGGKMMWSTWGLMFSQVVLLAARHVDLVVEVADVADDGLVLHLRHVVVVMTWKLPVAVTKMSACQQASSMVTTR
jgi:hypothetical protein